MWADASRERGLGSASGLQGKSHRRPGRPPTCRDAASPLLASLAIFSGCRQCGQWGGRQQVLQNSTAGSCKVSCQTPQPSAALLRGRHLRCHCRVRRATPEPARCTPWARHRGARELPRRAAGQSGGKGTRGHTLTVDRLAPITPYLADSGSERLIHGSVRRASCKELDVDRGGSLGASGSCRLCPADSDPNEKHRQWQDSDQTRRRAPHPPHDAIAAGALG